MHTRKVYVQVTAVFSKDGGLQPVSLALEDGRKYTIDRVLDVRPAAAMKAGGQGDRYTVRIRGQESYLFFERSLKMSDRVLGRWFVEWRH